MTKKIIPILLTLIIFLLNMNIVKASSFQFKAVADKEELKPGEDVTITMSIDNIEVEKGINVIEAWLEYDENIFENVEMENQNNWEITYNTESGERNGKFLIVKMVEGQTEREDVGKIKLKVKDDIKTQETEIKISKITSNDGTELIDEGERIIRFKINNPNDDNKNPDDDQKDPNDDNKDDDNKNPSDDNKDDGEKNSNNNNQNSNGSSTNNNKSEQSSSSNKTGSSTNNINTGDITIIVSVSVIALVVIVNIIIFIVRKKRKNKENEINK